MSKDKQKISGRAYYPDNQNLQGINENSMRAPEMIKFTNLVNHGSEPAQLMILKERIQQLERKVSELQGQLRHKKKRIRRRAQQIEKKYFCVQCQKRYGSIVSLNLHLKIKHKQKRQNNKEQKQAQH